MNEPLSSNERADGWTIGIAHVWEANEIRRLGCVMASEDGPLMVVLADEVSRMQNEIERLQAEVKQLVQSVENRDRELEEALSASTATETALHAFKNFHRLLCERFDYVHDEQDWQRDQLSLIEWIAKRYLAASAHEPPAVNQDCDPTDESIPHDACICRTCDQARWRIVTAQMMATGPVAPTAKLSIIGGVVDDVSMYAPLSDGEHDVFHVPLNPNGELHLSAFAQPPPADDACICKGNWRSIVKEVEHLIGKEFRNSAGNTYRFFGVVHGDDDYYYGMADKDGCRLLSCVGSLEGHGYNLTSSGPTKEV